MSEIEYTLSHKGFTGVVLSATIDGRHAGNVYFNSVSDSIDVVCAVGVSALRERFHPIIYLSAEKLIEDVERELRHMAEVARYYWLGVAAEMDARAKAKVAAA